MAYCQFILDSRSPRPYAIWYMSSEDFDKMDIWNVRQATGYVGGAFGSSQAIISQGELDTVIGTITIYQVSKIKDSLASIYQMCNNEDLVHVPIHEFEAGEREV